NRATRWARGRLTGTDPGLRELLALIAGYPRRFSLPQVCKSAFRALLREGICPGGTEFLMLNFKQKPGDKDSPWLVWLNCYDWQTGAPRPLDPQTDGTRSHVGKMEEGLLAELMYALF